MAISTGGKKCSFFKKFDVLFLETPVLRFALLPYYRRIGLISSKKILPVHVLTLECTSKNGQTQFKNPVAFAARFLD